MSETDPKKTLEQRARDAYLSVLNDDGVRVYGHRDLNPQDHKLIDAVVKAVNDYWYETRRESPL
jgi:hypothetical protein